jgi:hypothetical protein
VWGKQVEISQRTLSSSGLKKAFVLPYFPFDPSPIAGTMPTTRAFLESDQIPRRLV